MGRTKIPLDQLFLFNRMELDLVVEGHEIDLREQWEMNRRSSLLVAQPHVKEKLSNKHFPLPWDSEIEVETVSQVDKEKGRKLLEIQKKLKANGNSKD